MHPDSEISEKIIAFQQLLKANGNLGYIFPCDAEGLQRCHKYIGILSKAVLSDSILLQKILIRLGIHASIPKSEKILQSIINNINVSLLERFTISSSRNNLDKIFKLCYIQTFIAIHSLVHLIRAIQVQDAPMASVLSSRFSLAIAQIRVGVFTLLNGTVAKPQTERSFKNSFIKYAREMLQKYKFKCPRDFWGFLRMETADGPKCIGAYHFETTETDLRYHEGGPPKRGSTALRKCTILRYFNDSKKIIF